jgi:hypothetical protein
MQTPWLKSIRQTQKLTIFATQNAAPLAPMLATAITRFNALSQSLSLNVTYEASSTAPDPDTLSGANVQLSLANGAYKFKGLGADGDGFLAADARKGVTRFAVGGSEKDEQLVKAFIFLPARIHEHNFMKICMIVHEMVHASGLVDNAEHTSDGDPDIFCASLSPSGDGVQCGVFSSRIMPPIWMTERTAAKIRPLWSKDGS